MINENYCNSQTWVGGTVALAFLTRDSIVIAADGRTVTGTGIVISDNTIKVRCINNLVFGVAGADYVETILFMDECLGIFQQSQNITEALSHLHDVFATKLRLSLTTIRRIDRSSFDYTYTRFPIFRILVGGYLNELPCAFTEFFHYVPDNDTLKLIQTEIPWIIDPQKPWAYCRAIGYGGLADSQIRERPEFVEPVRIRADAEYLVYLCSLNHYEVDGVIRSAVLRRDGSYYEHIRQQRPKAK